MAQLDLNSIKKLDKARKLLHEKVYTTYTCFEQYGDKYVQIDTYGKSDRDMPGKVSQSIQIDKNTARFLIDLFTKEFEL